MKNKDKLVTELCSPTPIYAVSLVAKSGEKKHFANFYGQTIKDCEGLDQAAIEEMAAKNDVEIINKIAELEQKIKNGNFDKVTGELMVEVYWEQLGDFIHMDMARMDDVLYCTSVERAFQLFKIKYRDVGKTDKQILDEKLENFKISLQKSMEDFFD